MKRFLCFSFFLFSCFLPWFPSEAVAASRRLTPEQRFREHWTRHQLQLRSLKAKGLEAAAQRAAVTDIADIAVMQSTPALVTSPNPWDLDGTAVQFTPSGSGYTVSVVSRAFDTNMGAEIDLVNGVNPLSGPEPGDDAYVLQDFGFSFAFYGRNFSSMAVSSNGNVVFRPAGVSQTTFDNGAVESVESLSQLHNGLPRIAPFWHDLDGRAIATIGDRGVFFRREADRVLITWNRMRDFPNDAGTIGEHTFQLVLHNDGRVVFVFQSAILTSSALTGIGPGVAPGIPEVINLKTPPANVFTAGIAEFFAVSTSIDYFGVIQAFYESRPGRDVWDFVYFISDFDADLGDAFAFYGPLRNDVRGIGDDVFDLDPAGELGSRRLQGLLNLANLIEDYPEYPTQRFLGSNNALSVMAQEQGHRWGTYLQFPGSESGFLLGRDESHWNFFAHTESTLSTPAAPRSSGMEGNVWLDNGNGTFTSTGLIDGFSRFDHYTMGLRPPADVGPMFVIGNVFGTIRTRASSPRPAETVSGTRVNVTIDDVIQANGTRLPASDTSPKQWRVAWVLMTRGPATPVDSTIRKVTRYRLAWESYFAHATDFLGAINSALTDSTELRRIAVVSSADYNRAAAPAAIATIFGDGLTAGATEDATSVDLPLTLAGTSVLVNGRQARLYRASPQQINFVIPRDTSSSTLVSNRVVNSDSATIEIMRAGQLIRSGVIQMAPAVPSIYTLNSSGSGPGAILDAITFQFPPFNARQSNGDPNILAVFCTGIGPEASDGNIAGLVTARIGNQPASVLYAGPSSYPGMNQVNVVLPAGIASGTHNLELIRNGIVSNTVTIQIR